MDLFNEIRKRFSMDWQLPAQTAMFKLIEEQVKWTCRDMESFSKHAKRSTINPDDVKLLVRRNWSILDQMERL